MSSGGRPVRSARPGEASTGHGDADPTYQSRKRRRSGPLTIGSRSARSSMEAASRAQSTQGEMHTAAAGRADAGVAEGQQRGHGEPASGGVTGDGQRCRVTLLGQQPPVGVGCVVDAGRARMLGGQAVVDEQDPRLCRP